jgi:hypothetical protein
MKLPVREAYLRLWPLVSRSLCVANTACSRRKGHARVAVQTLDYYELVLVTMAAFPGSLQTEWQDYLRGQLMRAPYLRRAVLDSGWYTEELHALVAALA